MVSNHLPHPVPTPNTDPTLTRSFFFLSRSPKSVAQILTFAYTPFPKSFDILLRVLAFSIARENCCTISFSAVIFSCTVSFLFFFFFFFQSFLFTELSRNSISLIPRVEALRTSSILRSYTLGVYFGG